MNSMMDKVTAAIMTVAKSFSIHISETEVITELKIWNYNEKALDVKKRYEDIVQFINGHVFLNVFYLALAQYFYPPIYDILRECTGQGVTLHLALLLETEDKNFSVSDMKDSFEKLKKVLKMEKEIENFLYSEFYADERLVMYLTGSDAMPPLLYGMCSLNSVKGNETDGAVCTGLQELLKSYVYGRMRMIIQITGENDDVREVIVKKAYNSLKIPLLMIDLKELAKKAKEGKDIFRREIDREILFYKCGICFVLDDDVERNESIRETFEEWIYLYEEISQKPLCVISGNSTKIAAGNSIPVFNYIVKDNSIKKENIPLWEETAHKCNALLCIDEEKQYMENGLQRIKSSFTLEDVKISEKQKDKLLKLGNHIKYRRKVYEQWNMQEKYSYGKNMTVLFSGPPGTGKTMTAEALSRELDLPLYRADLSVVMDKYIGETEKRLEKIFNICESRNVILFFDEADVIFGKRGEIKDAKDKFSNSHVSYILQRIEQYDGMIILATNLKNNIDTAFLRRIKYVVEFYMPNSDIRREIWNNGFSGEIPTEGIDIEFLADKVELSGGYIKNIILNAAFSAAAEDSPVTMKHIIAGVENEYEKLGMFIPYDSFGKYREYLTCDVENEREEREYGIIYGSKHSQ